jgi:hypothetical protein
MIFEVKHTNDMKQKHQSCEAEIDVSLEPCFYSHGNVYLMGYGADRKEATESLRAQLLQLQQDLVETAAALDVDLGSVEFNDSAFLKDLKFVKNLKESQAIGAEERSKAAAVHNARFVREALAFVKRMLLADAAEGKTASSFSFETDTEFNVARMFAESNGFRFSIQAPTPAGMPAWALPGLRNITIEHGTTVVTR